MSTTIAGPDGKPRCKWCSAAPEFVDYHDTEWRVPEWDSRALWEKLILDGFQAGLSWITILKKREAFREAFAGFENSAVFGRGWIVAGRIEQLQKEGDYITTEIAANASR